MTPTRSPSFLHYALALSVTGLVALLVLIHHPPPRPKPVDCEAKQFSAERARADIASLTAFGPRPVGLNGQPHPEAHRQARDFVMQRLRDLGLSPELQIGPSCLRDRCAQVENIIARRAAAGLADQREPLVLLSHYDSVARGPGAGDAASGVATILEVLRALEVQAIWQRPLVVVIDDGEEAGLLGARLLPSHRWLSRVAAVLNHEARGTGGQTAMFEASRHSTWLVEAYATSVERPMAASAIYPLYKLLPNDTDLTVLQAAGWRGLNFAFAERAHQYHTAQDSLEFLDLGSVQHMGDQSLGTARAVLARSTIPSDDRDGVWFELFTRHLVLYRTETAAGLAIVQATLWLLAIGLLIQRQRGQALRLLLLGIGRFVLVILVAAVVGAVVSKLIASLSGGSRPWLSQPLPTWLALSTLTVAVTSLFQLLACRLSPPSSLDTLWGQSLGTLLPWTLASLLCSLKQTDASYLFTLPALVASLAIFVGMLRVRSEEQTTPALALAMLMMTATTIIWLPMIRVLFVLAGANLHFAVTIPWAVLISLADPLHRLFPMRLRVLMPTALSMLGGTAIAVAVLGR